MQPLIDFKTTKIEVHVFPQFIAAALKLREDDLYILWLCCKVFDSEINASGYIAKCTMIDFAQWIFGISTTQLYDKINRGQGIYWGKFAGKKGDKHTSLYSYERVAKHLDPKMTRSEAFLMYLSDFICSTEDDNGNFSPIKNNWKRIHKLLIGMVVAKNIDSRPTSYSTIINHTSLSRSTIYRNIRDCQQVKVYRNMAQILISNDPTYLDRKREAIVADGGKPLVLIKMSACQFALMEVLPNSYEILGYERLEVKKRPKILKHYDSINAAEASQRIYFIDKPKTGDKNLQYTFSGETFMDNRKRQIVLWQENRL